MRSVVSPGQGQGSRGLTTQVVADVGRRIVTGEILPGSVLQPDAVSEEYAVSRTVVREAFRVLQHKGLVASRPRAGTKVLDRTHWNSLDLDLIGWRSGVDPTGQGQELLQMRRAIEPMAAALAAHRVDEPLRERISTLCASMQDSLAARDPEAFRQADVRFHDAVLTAAKNAMMAQLSDIVTESLHLLHSQEVTTEQLDPRAVALHVAVAEAIVAGDAERARAAMTALVDMAETRIKDDEGPEARRSP